MAIHILSGKNNFESNLIQSTIHSVPFRIQADCDANVSKYFENYIEPSTSDKQTLTASFRGYPLHGRKIKCPEGYKGVVLHESIKPIRDKDDRKFYAVNNFEELVYWNWDKKPSQNDCMAMALDWIDVAEALHGPVLEE